MKPPLVFKDIIPRQKSNAANHDQQHFVAICRDIDHRILDITGKGRIQIMVRSQNVKPCVAKGGDGVKYRHPDPAPSIVAAKHRQHGKRADQLDQERSPQDESCQPDDPSDLRAEMASCMMLRCIREILRPDSSANDAATVTTPSPPI